jgi:hypothetical protein
VSRLWAALLLVAAPACLVQYRIAGGGSEGGGSEGDTCPEGQEPCGAECAPEDACDECPEGQVKCGSECAAPDACDDDTCPEGQIPCDGECALPAACGCEAGCDPERERCEDGVCACRPGLARCGAVCVDPNSDPAHCGECDRPCEDGTLCQTGACVGGCADGHTPCAGACVDLGSHPLHCDACDAACDADELCVAASCRPYAPIDGCDACPCADACGAGEGEAQCCHAPFLDAPVCVDGGCE